MCKWLPTGMPDVGPGAPLLLNPALLLNSNPFPWVLRLPGGGTNNVSPGVGQKGGEWLGVNQPNPLGNSAPTKGGFFWPLAQQEPAR